MSISTSSGTTRKGTWLILLVGFAHGTTHLAGQGFYNLVPYIQQELQLDYVQVGAFGFIMQLSGFAANFIGAPLVDMSGRRVLIMALALAICSGAFFLIGSASSFLTICAALIVMGICISSWHPPAISYLSSEFSDRRGFALSMHGSFASLGETLGPIIAGLLVAAVAWRASTGWLALPMLVMGIVLLITILPNDAVTRAKSKAKGGFSARDYIAGLKTMVMRPVIAGLCLVAAFRAVAQVGLTLFLPVYLVNDLGFDPLKTGIVMTCLFIGGIIAAPIMGVVSDRIGRRPVVMAGMGASTLVIISLTLIEDTKIFVGAVSMLGFILFAIRPVLHSWLMDLTPPEMGGSATALMFSSQYLLAMAMALIGGIVANAFGLIYVFYMMAGSMLLANIAVMILPKELSQEEV
jgi:MFS family permease